MVEGVFVQRRECVVDLEIFPNIFEIVFDKSTTEGTSTQGFEFKYWREFVVLIRFEERHVAHIQDSKTCRATLVIL